jgi:ABC-type Fe3+-siderophore transport system permease subunit
MLALSDETVSLQIVLSWVLGGVQTPTWPILGLLAILSAACLGLTLLFARGLDMIGLGEGMATAFGLDVNSLRRARRCSRAPSSWRPRSPSAGLVAFVGLAAPISRAGWSADAPSAAAGFRAGRGFDRRHRGLRSRGRRCRPPKFPWGW